MTTSQYLHVRFVFMALLAVVALFLVVAVECAAAGVADKVLAWQNLFEPGTQLDLDALLMLRYSWSISLARLKLLLLVGREVPYWRRIGT